jgi:ABC-2 type transport system permease protein
MTRHEPLLPNAAIVAGREYRERVRTRLFVVSTILLAIVAVTVALAPLLIRVAERTTTARVLVVAAEPELQARTIGSLEAVLNLPPSGATPTAWTPRYVVESRTDEADAVDEVRRGDAVGALVVTRDDAGALRFAFHSRTYGQTTESQLVGFGSLAAAILDWQSTLPPGAEDVFHPPTFDLVPTELPEEGGAPVDPASIAARSFLAIAFVVLIFITLVIYGMWVASGVAAEKSSRVMELMISAASPVQLLVGKVVGLGAAGLTQYAAILLPALVVLLLQERLADVLLGPGAGSTTLAGLTAPLLAAFLVFFLMGFALYALIYAAAGSLVSRPEDLQVVSLPLSIISMAGYLMAVGVIGGAGGMLVRLASYVPFWSPFVMLARLMVSRVEPWEPALALALLGVSIVIALRFAIRIYSAGVLLYGQRPGMRAFLLAARAPR